MRPGDCLAVYDTGQGRWSAQAPYRVGCGGGNALVQVSAVRSSSAGCPTGAGRSYWTYTSASGTTALCLTRQFHVGYCLLAEERGSGDGLRMHAGLMTAVDCEARRIPSQYDRILHITGVYAAPADANAAHCARVQGDRTRYFAWVVDGGRTLLCTMVFTG
ncbi:hypothetical protein IHE55_26370 [Streptomyces pactum]|uniref:Ricin B lectin domain-containing protein n=1 Tax=Streptomyces pactum TaxID=68249 RepID=A0ABS0NSC6_9ACTN|nr:hypothetical protein [Streptomyces pactum]MBH5338114.1 hypothetical protein [Streptomyces pactum]